MRRFGSLPACDWLIVGLGNPGERYARTRHNAGFMALDELSRRWQGGRRRKRFAGEIAAVTLRHEGKRAAALMLWPQTFMNDAGRSVGPAFGALKLKADQLLVLHDEIDLPFGEVRTRLGGGLAGHNGLKSVAKAIGGGDFWRVRLGVGRPAGSDPELVAAHVLAPFAESRPEVAELIGRSCDAAEALIFGAAN